MMAKEWSISSSQTWFVLSFPINRNLLKPEVVFVLDTISLRWNNENPFRCVQVIPFPCGFLNGGGGLLTIWIHYSWLWWSQGAYERGWWPDTKRNSRLKTVTDSAGRQGAEEVPRRAIVREHGFEWTGNRYAAQLGFSLIDYLFILYGLLGGGVMNLWLNHHHTIHKSLLHFTILFVGRVATFLESWSQWSQSAILEIPEIRFSTLNLNSFKVQFYCRFRWDSWLRVDHETFGSFQGSSNENLAWSGIPVGHLEVHFVCFSIIEWFFLWNSQPILQRKHFCVQKSEGPALEDSLIHWECVKYSFAPEPVADDDDGQAYE